MSGNWGYYTVDFVVNETGIGVSVSNVRAVDGDIAEQVAKEMLNPAVTYRCIGIDRKREAA